MDVYDLPIRSAPRAGVTVHHHPLVIPPSELTLWDLFFGSLELHRFGTKAVPRLAKVRQVTTNQMRDYIKQKRR